MTPLQAQRASQIHTLREALARLAYSDSVTDLFLREQFWTALADVAMGVDLPFVEAEVALAESLLHDAAA